MTASEQAESGAMSRLVPHEALEQFVHAVLTAAGVEPYSAQRVAHSLAETSLRGTDSHGVRLLFHYMKCVRDGGINPRPNMTYQQRMPCIGVLDANDAFGQAAGWKAMEHAMEMAGKLGMGLCTVINSNHPGAMYQYCVPAAKKGFIAFAFTNTGSIIVAHGARDAYFGTNPIAFAAPRLEQEPICLDMATSIIPWNMVMHAQHTGEPLPLGVAVDAEGQPTTDAQKTKALVSIGTYKGFGLSALVEIMSALLNGMPFGQHATHMYGPKSDTGAHRFLGQTYFCIRADACVAAEDFAKACQQMSDEIRSMKPAEGNPNPVMVMGDPEIREAERRSKEGIPVDPVVWADFESMAATYNGPLPTANSADGTSAR
eukprot:TRINITY_DN5080_c0_g1_i1.p1 TRINITY_DN5080_c0_g1~~TRINITY_DN5080_c0_g1_i1.p1  ORF type:complete len:372 (-),score=80.10 TRINITY_DN5080_c0_g1_i1:268-1383(-)